MTSAPPVAPGPQEPEDTLVLDMQAGSEEAWSVAYEALHRPLLGYLRYRGAHEPEDALSEVFLRLARAIGTFEGDFDDLRRYSYVVAANLMRDEARARGRRPVTSAGIEDFDIARSPVASAEEEALESGEFGRLIEPIAELTPEQQHVIFLRVVADLPVREVARIVGRSQGAVKMLYLRAMASLRETMGGRSGT